MALPKIQFAAPVIRAAITQLETYMAGQVAVFNAEGNAQIVAPATYHFGGQDLLNAYAYPQVEVAVPSGMFGRWAIGRTEADHDERLNVAIWVAGGEGDVPKLYEQLVGMIRCAIECLAPAHALGAGVDIPDGPPGITWRVDVVPNDPTAFGPAEKGEQLQKWIGSGLIQVPVETVEHFV